MPTETPAAPPPPAAPDAGATVDDGYVCTCLQITEKKLLRTLAKGRVSNLRELRRATGAGGGCTACHPLLQRYLDARGQAGSCPPICSAR